MTIGQQHPRRPVSLPAVLLLACAMLSGCATLAQSIETPDVTIAGLRLMEAGFSRQVYELDLNVGNPNPIPLPVRGLAYRIQLAGEEFAAGETVSAFTVPANGEAGFSVSITTDLLRSLSGVQRMIEQRDQVLTYQIGGELQVNLPFVKALPFSKTGEIDLANAYRY
ncbi:MAG: LEA type 2 family protein [Gammaproteobacteria bacterium]|nr:LEA type 2 family protein [Gammaproteobacteria bacterium]